MHTVKGIKGKIILNMVGTLVVVLAVTALAIYITANSVVTRTLNDTLTPYARTASKSVEDSLHLLVDRMYTLSKNNVLISTEETEESKIGVINEQMTQVEFNWIGIYDSNGNKHYGSERSYPSLAGTSLLQGLVESGSITISDPIMGDDGLEISVGVPLVNGDTTEYMVGSYKYDMLDDVIGGIDIGLSGYAFIVNKENMIVSHAKREYVQDKKNISEVYPGIAKVVDKITSGTIGTSEIKLDGKVNTISYSPVRGVNWYLAIIVPKSDFTQVSNFSIIVTLGILSVLSIIAVLTSTIFSSKVEKALGLAVDRMHGLSKGDLNTKVSVVKTGDEAEWISVALMDTVDKLNSYISQLQSALQSVLNGNLNVQLSDNFAGDFKVMKVSLESLITFMVGMVKGLKESANDLTTFAQRFDGTARVLIESSNEQSDYLSRVSTESRAVLDAILKVDTRTKEVRDFMEQSMEKIGLAGEYVNNTLQSMESIMSNSNEINKVTRIIEDIAFQTDILAINAVIEAAHAGEAGRGFAVLAKEIRMLSEKSADSSRVTSQMIDSTQESIALGSKYAKETSKFFDELQEIYKKTYEITNSLEKLVENETGRIKNTSNDVEKATSMSLDNLSNSHEIASLSQELGVYATVLDNLVKHFNEKR